MDQITATMMNILEDLAQTKDNVLEAEYVKYYDSLDKRQSKVVVEDAIRKILADAKGNCDFGEDSFKLVVEN